MQGSTAMENSLSYAYKVLNLELTVTELEKDHSVISYCSLQFLNISRRKSQRLYVIIRNCIIFPIFGTVVYPQFKPCIHL